MSKFGRGKCSICPYKWPLRKNGNVQAHKLTDGVEWRPCLGGGKPPYKEPELSQTEGYARIIERERRRE